MAVETSGLGLVVSLLVNQFLVVVVHGQGNATTVAPTSITPTGEPTTVPANTELGPCTCDLTLASCDVNCCCDPDCSNADRLAFSECTNQIHAANVQMCVTGQVMFDSNTPYIVNVTNPSLFCIQTDNYQERNYYQIPQIASDLQTFNQYGERFSTPGYGVTSSENAVFNFLQATHYKSGDPVYTLFPSLALGVLSLPKAVNTRACNDNNAIAYLFDDTSECVREIQPIAQSCQTDPTLNAESYYKNFKVASLPELFKPVMYNASDPASAIYIPLYNDTRLLEVTPQLPGSCLDLNGITSNCPDFGSPPTPQYDNTTKTCNYAVSEVHYTISHNATEGIKTALVNFVFKTITDASLPLTQTYKISWEGVNENVTYHRSGNPGYVYDQPVVAGRLTQDIVNGETRQAILLNKNSDTWLTILSSTTSGDCSGRTPVKFGVNMRSGCTITVHLNNMTDNCQIIQETAKDRLLGGPSPAEYVATFGNSNVEKVGDWIPILTENEPPLASGPTAGLCSSVVLGMNLEIVYANVGSLANPQPKILGVARVFDQPQDLRYQCTGPYCQADTTSLPQNFELVSSVTFIDASQPAVPFYAERPLLAVRLPYDFFYPFLSGSSIAIRFNSLNLIMSLFACFIFSKIHFEIKSTP